MAQLDASLIGGYKPIEVPDQVNMLAKALQLQGAIGQNRLQQIQLQQGQASFDATNRLNAMLQDDPTLAQDPKRLMASGGTYALPLVKNLLETQKAQGEMQATAIGNADKGRAAVASLAGALSSKPDLSPDDMVRFQQEAAKLGVQVTPADFAGANSTDSARAALRRYQAQGLTADQQITQNNPTILPTEMGIAAVNKDGSGGRMVPNISGAASYPNGNPGIGPGMGAPAPSMPPGMVEGHQTPGPSIWEANLRTALSDPDPNVRKEAQTRLVAMTPGLSKDFAQGAAAVPAGTQVTAPAQAVPLGGKPQGTWETDPITGQKVYAPKFANPGDVLGGSGGFKPTQADQALIDQIGKYQIAPPNANAIRNPHEAAILAEVARQYPTFDATEFPARQKALRDFTTGPQGNALRSVSVASDHLSQLADVADALKNGNYPLLNKLSNLYTTNTGGTAPNTFDAMKQIVGDEVVKAILGGSAGGVHDRAELAARLSAASSPAQLSEVIRSYRDLMGAQKDGLISQYENTTGRTDAAERFNFSKKAGGTPAPVPKATIDALLSKYGG